MYKNTTTLYCTTTRQYAVLATYDLGVGLLGEPEIICVGTAAPSEMPEPTSAFETKHQFDGACIQHCGMTVEEWAEEDRGPVSEAA